MIGSFYLLANYDWLKLIKAFKIMLTVVPRKKKGYFDIKWFKIFYSSSFPQYYVYMLRQLTNKTYFFPNKTLEIIQMLFNSKSTLAFPHVTLHYNQIKRGYIRQTKLNRTCMPNSNTSINGKNTELRKRLFTWLPAHHVTWEDAMGPTKLCDQEELARTCTCGELHDRTVGNHFASYPTDRICPYFVLVTDRSA